MTTNTRNAIGIVAYEVSILPSEMEMIAHTADRCKMILDNHNSQEKKVYLDDSDIEVMLAICRCISHDYDQRNQNSIESFLERRKKEQEKCVDGETDEADEAKMLCVK